MPLESFICPDKQTIKVEECLAKCRMSERCLTQPTLKLISTEREWKGVASTTQLLNGTMYEYLKLTKPYTVDPDSRMYMLQGTKHHKALEEVAKELGLASEVPLSIDRDIFDLLEVEDGELVLTDYKLWGSFKIAKALGLVEVGRKPNPNGEVYKTSGKWGKAGSPKMIGMFETDLSKVDNWEAELQLNRYRVMLDEQFNIKIKRMQLQVTVRDSGLGIAEGRGLFRNAYRVPVRFIDNEQVKLYFFCKDTDLKEALANGWSILCTDRECWSGNRCKDYCDIACYCPRGLASKGDSK